MGRKMEVMLKVSMAMEKRNRGVCKGFSDNGFRSPPAEYCGDQVAAAVSQLPVIRTGGSGLPGRRAYLEDVNHPSPSFDNMPPAVPVLPGGAPNGVPPNITWRNSYQTTASFILPTSAE